MSNETSDRRDDVQELQRSDDQDRLLPYVHPVRRHDGLRLMGLDRDGNDTTDYWEDLYRRMIEHECCFDENDILQIKQLKAISQIPTALEFRYLNHRDEWHLYVIRPTSYTYREDTWYLNGIVVTRDGDERPEMGPSRRRSFEFSKLPPNIRGDLPMLPTTEKETSDAS